MPEVNPNIVRGLASNMDTQGIIDKLIAAERRQIKPIEIRKERKYLEIDAWKQIEARLSKIRDLAETITKNSLWEGKLVTSSHPEIVDAVATSGAKIGKHTLIVDKLALNHQIVSQNYADKQALIGTGVVRFILGEGENSEEIRY